MPVPQEYIEKIMIIVNRARRELHEEDYCTFAELLHESLEEEELI